MPDTISRRQLLWLPMAAPLAAAFNAQAQRNRRMNVLFIAVDDLNNRIGCYGDPIVKTPNVDRLAARGVRFDHSYCNYPLCNPTRTSLLSGRRPETTKVFDNTTWPRKYLGDSVVFLPEYFHKSGYFTARCGKIAHGAFEDAVSWDISESQAGVPLGKREGFETKEEHKANKRKKRNRVKGEEGGQKLSWRKTDNQDEDEPDGATARRIAQLLEQHKQGPFFLAAGFHKPHLPWVAPKKYFDLYDPRKIPLPATPKDDLDDIPRIALTHTEGTENMTDLDKKTAIAAYHAATSFMDAQLGVLLDTMDRLKLWENTVVFFWGDHGWHLDDHMVLWRKSTVFEEAAHAPLIVAAPGKKAGVGCPRLVEFVDMYPTLTDLCGLPPAEGLEGTSFAPLLDDPQRPWKKAAFTVVSRGKGVLGHSVRTERYRYTEWDNEQAAELYDHEKDIHEWTNLAFGGRLKDPNNAQVLSEMKRVLHAGWKAALPPR